MNQYNGWLIGEGSFGIQRDSCGTCIEMGTMLPCMVCLLGFSAALGEEAGEPSAATILAKVQARYGSIERMQALFKQVTFNATMAKEQTASGFYYAEKPGKVRWDYETPEAQHLVISGGKVLFYVPTDKQLVYSDAGQVEELKALLDLLGGKGNIMERFKARLIGDDQEAQKAGCRVVRIVPKKPMGNLLRIDLVIDKKTLLVKETAYWDIYGNRTRISFSGIKMPKSFDGSLFKLNVPQDVVVVDAAGNPVKSGLSSGEASLTESRKSDARKEEAK